jgi:hypothetical protein
MNIAELFDEKRSVTYSTILGVWAMVATYAVLHDQYIAQIAPEHFTEYHPQIWGIEDPYRLAAALAFCASLGPGLLLGTACLLAARFGSFPKQPIKSVFHGVVAVIVATEFFSASLGYWVYYTKQRLLPTWCYPDHSLPLLVTQTIQISCYLLGALFSGVLLVYIVSKRYRNAHDKRRTRSLK